MGAALLAGSRVDKYVRVMKCSHAFVAEKLARSMLLGCIGANGAVAGVGDCRVSWWLVSGMAHG